MFVAVHYIKDHVNENSLKVLHGRKTKILGPNLCPVSTRNDTLLTRRGKFPFYKQ